jgi:hypothetical protein
MLDDLLNEPLDPGYRLAFQSAQGSQPSRGRRWWDGPLLWLACVAVGLLLVVAYQQQHRSAPAREAARKDRVVRRGGRPAQRPAARQR